MASPVESPLSNVRAIGVITSDLPVRIAQSVGLTASAWLAAQTTLASIHTVPVLLLAPASTLLAQWKLFARRTNVVGPLLRLLASAIFVWLGQRTMSVRRLYPISATLLTSSLLYNLIFSRNAATELSARASAAAATADMDAAAAIVDAQENAIAREQKRKTRFPRDYEPLPFATFISTHVSPGIAWPFFESAGVTRPANSELSAHQLLDKWGWFNLGSAALTLAGAATATWAVANEGLGIIQSVDLSYL